MRLYGFSENELAKIGPKEHIAIKKAIVRKHREDNLVHFLSQDYALLMNAQPTDSKGKVKSSEKMKLTKKAQKIKNYLTSDEGDKKPTMTKAKFEDHMKKYKGVSAKDFIKLINKK